MCQIIPLPDIFFCGPLVISHLQMSKLLMPLTLADVAKVSYPLSALVLYRLLTCNSQQLPDFPSKPCLF